MNTVGIDVGYGFTKAAAAEQEAIIFPSLVGTAESLDFDPGLASNGGMTIHVNGRSYFVGDRAALQAGVLTRTLDRSRVTSEEAKVLFLAALSSVSSPRGPETASLWW